MPRQNSPWNKLISRTLGTILGMHHKEHVWKSSAKIGAIGVMMARRFWCVHINALGAIGLHHCLAGDVRQTCK